MNTYFAGLNHVADTDTQKRQRRQSRPGESKQQVRLVCGFCSFDEGLKHPLFFGLPTVIVFRRHATGNSPWLAEAVRVITMEANLGEMGISAIISRLIEVLFIQGIRHQRDTESNPPFALPDCNYGHQTKISY